MHPEPLIHHRPGTRIMPHAAGARGMIPRPAEPVIRIENFIIGLHIQPRQHLCFDIRLQRRLRKKFSDIPHRRHRHLAIIFSTQIIGINNRGSLGSVDAISDVPWLSGRRQ